MEREDFTRLKKVQAKKQEKQKQEDAVKKQEDAAVAAASVSSGNAAAVNVLHGYDANDDDDVVFK